MVERMLEGIPVQLGVDYLADREKWDAQAKRIVFTGAIDEFYGFCFGNLAYRKVTFEHEVLDTDNFQGNAVVNYTEREIPYTRIIEHKHFVFGKQPKTVISKEYPTEWKPGEEPYYPVGDAANRELYERYAELSKKDAKVIFGGRLGEYKYYDMDKVIARALEKAAEEFA